MSHLSPNAEAKLAEFIAQFYDDAYGFVMAAYPWGVPILPDGSRNPLAHRKGPDKWQKRLLDKLSNHVKENMSLVSLGLEMEVFRSVRVSGHGVGKSAVVAWVIQWLMSTRKNMRGVVTANTQAQLETKTWPELAKWHKLLINSHWFKWRATAYFFAAYPEEQQKNYMVNAATVSPENTEAFAGLHNEGGTVLVIADEASGIEDKVIEVIQGAFTDGECFFLMFGNPTQPSGMFHKAATELRDLFDVEHIDSREVEHTNKSALNDIIRMYGGVDDDRVKVRVLGQFPSQAFNGLIGLDVVATAATRELWYDPGAALIMAIDVARFGDDRSVITFRQGRDARSRKPLSFNGLSTTKLAEIAMKIADVERPDAIVIESTGPGAGVIDQMRDKGYRVIEVHPGAQSSEPAHYFNKRAELWCLGRDWLILEGCISEDPELHREMTAIQYTLDSRESAIRLEPKEDMKKRTGLPSPDKADSFFLTFGARIARRDRAHSGRTNRMQLQTEYDPLTV
jgi:hypothetical protein